MIKISKKVALFLMIALTIIFGASLNGINWQNIDGHIFRELKKPSMFLSLAIFYMIYYVRLLNQEKEGS